MTEGARASDKKDPLAEEFLQYLANERNASPRTLKAYRQALTAFRAENQTPWKRCRADDFRDYLFAIAKRGQARSYVRLQFSALRTFYQFLGSSKGTAQQSRARSTIAKNREETAARPHAPTSRRTPCCPNAREEEQICAGLDASARCRHYGIVLQQWLAAERTGCAGRG